MLTVGSVAVNWLTGGTTLVLAGIPIGVFMNALYNTYLKHRETPVDGWHFRTSRDRWVNNGESNVDVIVRFMGPMTVYEVKVRSWGDVEIPDGQQWESAIDSIPKISCEDDPIEIRGVKYPKAVSEGSERAVGVTWMQPYRWRVQEHGARIELDNDEYQRWRWRWIRNALLPWAEPVGRWKTVKHKSRKQFYIP